MTYHLAYSEGVGPIGYVAILLAIILFTSGSMTIFSAYRTCQSYNRWIHAHIFALIGVIAIAFALHFIGMKTVYEFRYSESIESKQEASDFIVIATVDTWFSGIIAMGAFLGSVAAIASKYARQTAPSNR